MRKGNNRQQGRGRQAGRRMNMQLTMCVCNRCGYTCEHMRGVPCRNSICPNCGSVLTKMDAAGQNVTGGRVFQSTETRTTRHGEVGGSLTNESTISERTTNRKSKTDNEIPVVDSNKCIACGTCVDVCRRNAITLVGGVAQISPELCVNCGLCVRKCPEGAIS